MRYGNRLVLASGDGDTEVDVVPVDDSERTNVRRGETRLYTTAPNKNMRAIVQIRGQMNNWASMSGSVRWLKTRDFKTQVGESSGALTFKSIL